MNSTSGPEFFIQKYIYPLVLAQTKEELVKHMSYGTIIYVILIMLMPKSAPYGRYTPESKKLTITPKLAWLVQESPSFCIPLILVYYGNRNETFHSVSNQMCLGMFMLHYFQRTFIFSILIKSKQSIPVSCVVAAFFTTLYNGTLHGFYFIYYQSYSDKDWLMKPYFWIGFAMFLYGMSINIGSDAILRNLRRNDWDYHIPEGGLFEYVSCANYFGEIIEMWGYALASCALPAIAFAIFTTLHLSKRATQHHQWYLKKFDNYPKNRKAIIPFVL